MNSKLLVTILSALVFAGARLQAAGDDTVLLNTLGYTTGQSVLLTHMAVGTLADAYVAKTYKSDQASTFITTWGAYTALPTCRTCPYVLLSVFRSFCWGDCQPVAAPAAFVSQTKPWSIQLGVFIWA